MECRFFYVLFNKILSELFPDPDDFNDFSKITCIS